MKKKSVLRQSSMRRWLLLLMAFVSVTQMVSGQDDLTALNETDVNIQNDDQRLNISQKNIDTKELMEKLEAISGYKFVFDKSILDYKKRFTIKEKGISFNELLNKVSEQSRLRFKKVNDNINVRLAEPTSSTSTLDEAQADVVITGQVSGTDGIPLLGVSVVVQGGDIGTVTNFDGNYTLTVPEGSVLVFSFIGMRTQYVPVADQTVINVVMEEDVAALNEVIVVGYGSQKRSDITGAIGVVGSEEFEDEPVVQVGQALQGKVAGLQVTQNSGSPGSGLLIRVRGAGTVNNAEPLYVVDGNPNADPIDLIPEQIESIQVLKSASASAIYGAQGANGVILITTKQGRPGKSRLDINFSQGFQQIQRNVPVTNATEYATLYNEGLVNAGGEPLYDNPEALGVGTDWQKAVFQMAPMTNITVSANGGSESSRYFFSGGYTDQEGIVKGTSFNRVNLRINSSHDITPGISIGQNLSASVSSYENISEFSFGSILGNTLTANPEIPVKFPDGSWGYSETSLNSTNPAASIHYTNNDTKRKVVNGNVYVDITFLKNFVFRSQYNFNIGDTENVNFSPQYEISSRIFNNIASLTETTNRFDENSWANTLNYTANTGKHNIDALVGFTTQESTTKRVLAEGAGLPANATFNENLRYLDLNTQSNRVEGSGGSYGILSYLGRVNYNYAGKYFTTVNFRADGSSRFGENNKWGYFPSFSLGWKLSEEKFLEDTEWIDNLMLRGGWGSLGNQSSLPNYAFASLVTPNINYVFGSQQEVYRGQAPIGQGNPNLKWESTDETNFGFDFNGFDGKVNASFDYYHKQTTDMLLQVPLAGYSGLQSFPFVNGGEVVNKGFEFLLGYENTTPGGLNYSISGNIARNKNEVVDLSNAGSSLFQRISFVGLVNVTQEGSPIASFYGWETDGLFQTQQEVDNHAFQSSGTAPGDIRFKDLNGDGVVNAEDQTIIGNPWPKFIYGFNGSLSYKNFDFRVQLNGVAGNEIFAGYKFRTEGSNFFNYTRNVWENRWTGPGTSNTVPRVNTDDPNNNMRSSEYYLENGSYLRVRNIQMSYKFPENVFNDAATVSIYASVQNAFTFTNYPGFDPELGTNNSSNPLYVGIDETIYPVPRIYTIGLKVGL
ncbi:SusC/RagA family TonB-linked outer membrane protein [Allomuricauda sp. CP2A]|uniref:SusC/RagA family TonB-linked outer membrane protein n=1 Tax=Allomuricauda sp. CP2A TaxID=1848189 RepID=UPI0009F38036|nr:TonB-dependent receptor [Muricauda sp. CP2A]